MWKGRTMQRSTKRQSRSRSAWSNISGANLSLTGRGFTGLKDQDIYERMALYLIVNRHVADFMDDDLVSAELWRVWETQGKDRTS